METDAHKKQERLGRRGIKIAILSSFTFSGIKKPLIEVCEKSNIDVKIYLGNYNQYVQEIFDTNSSLYSFNPDLVIIFADIQSLLGDTFFLPYGISDADRRRWEEETENTIIGLLDFLAKQVKAKVVFHNFLEPTYSPLGILENKQEFGFFESIRTLNQAIENYYKKSSQVYVFDYNSFCSRVGKNNIFDYRMYYLGDLKVSFNSLKLLAEDYLSYIKPIAALSRKCIVLDLDNTLWGGVIGEDGLDGIRLGPTPEGRPFWEFQKMLLSLYKRGIMLAVNSKNNKEDVLRVLREHPYMVLREEHFLSMKINWHEKVSNMLEISKDLNIGLDSFVFFDDDKINQEIMRKYLPQVNTVDLPDDPAMLVDTLKKINDFNLLQITEEDRNRNAMYAIEKKREQLKFTSQSLDDFLGSLKIKLTILPAETSTFSRISQLTNKTNQFNLTTKRYSEEEIIEFAESNNYLINGYKVEDKFGDYGIVGVTIINVENKKEWFIDSFLLSCRVIGKNIEFSILGEIIKCAKKAGVAKLYGEFIPTEKNKPAEDFYLNSGFKLLTPETVTKKYSFNLATDQVKIVNHIDIIK